MIFYRSYLKIFILKPIYYKFYISCRKFRKNYYLKTNNTLKKLLIKPEQFLKQKIFCFMSFFSVKNTNWKNLNIISRKSSEFVYNTKPINHKEFTVNYLHVNQNKIQIRLENYC